MEACRYIQCTENSRQGRLSPPEVRKQTPPNFPPYPLPSPPTSPLPLPLPPNLYLFLLPLSILPAYLSPFPCLISLPLPSLRGRVSSPPENFVILHWRRWVFTQLWRTKTYFKFKGFVVKILDIIQKLTWMIFFVSNRILTHCLSTQSDTKLKTERRMN